MDVKCSDVYNIGGVIPLRIILRGKGEINEENR